MNFFQKQQSCSRWWRYHDHNQCLFLHQFSSKKSSLFRRGNCRKLNRERLFGGGASNIGTWFLCEISIWKKDLSAWGRNEGNKKTHCAGRLAPRLPVYLHRELFLRPDDNFGTLSKTFPRWSQPCSDLRQFKSIILTAGIRIIYLYLYICIMFSTSRINTFN